MKTEKQKTLDEARSKLDHIKDEMVAIGELDEITPGQSERFTRLEQGYDKLKPEVDRLEREVRAERVKAARASVTVTEGGASGMHYAGQPVARSVPSTGLPHVDQARDEARSVIDTAHSSGLLPDHAAERAERLVTTGRVADQAIAARWASATGDPAYLRAFAHLAADPARGHLLWTEEERAAYQRVAEVRAAMSLGSTHGQEMLPLTLDPTILLTSDGSINPLRRISRVEQTMTNAWQGVTSAGATAEWKTEAAEAADGSPTLADKSIPVHLGDAFVPYSYEIGMDAVGFVENVARVLVDAADNLQATAFTTGTGSGQPKGVIKALTGTSSEINSTGSEALIAADAYALQNALPPRFQDGAQWGANIATINELAQLETTNGALQFPEIRQSQLLRKPLNEISNMDGAINAAATESNFVLVYGDFSQFVIVDRIGTSIEFIPNLVGANGRPTGQRGMFLWFRTGSDVVVPEAFRLLDVPTTA